tara:strand:+ start:59 stop:328 length:270 start_codon:yes stop_codon:yes gene_type:complete
LSNIIPETNKHYIGDSETKFVAYDRIYQNLHKTLNLVQKNGSTYTGKIEKKSIKLKDGTLSFVHKTADNRWFDRHGMPIEKPTNLITHK